EDELGRRLSVATRELAREISRRAAAPAAPVLPRPVEPVEPAARRPTSGILTLLLTDAPGARAELAVNDGEAVEETGSELVAAFARPSDALACALRIQRSKKKRFAIDTGERGIVERARRLLVAARPGQVLCSEETAVLLRRDLEAGVR